MRVLLINPPQHKFYANTEIKGGVIYSPSLTLAALAAPLVNTGHEVKILDLNFNPQELKYAVKEFSPDFVGITFTTPLFGEAKKIARLIKSINDKIIVIGGGAHVTALPKETLEDSDLDIGVIGEGDFILPRLINGEHLEDIRGIGYKVNGGSMINPRAPYIKHLDNLPFPAYGLFNLKKYETTPLLTRRNPAG